MARDELKTLQNQRGDPSKSRLHREGRRFESVTAYQPKIKLSKGRDQGTQCLRHCEEAKRSPKEQFRAKYRHLPMA
jgi:hypothetical protein